MKEWIKRVMKFIKCLLGCCLCKRTTTVYSRVNRDKGTSLIRRNVTYSSEPALNAITRIILAIGLVCALVNLAKSMDPIALMQLSKFCDACTAKATAITNSLEVAFGCLQEYSRQMDEMKNRMGNIESRLHVTTNLMQECSRQMDKMANRFAKVECLLRKIEQKPCALKVEGYCNCWCPCCLLKVGCQ